ncbi:PA14 domain-containing protein [Hymenobacter tibetensis]|uniref:PA14 domain-containing protein n=1 Tax=Hymenobacter tibetensis TaxID=497967 RepID=A0ABY4CYG0_9BACT|nr:PA14 domain-containing protein [Hymenobacter tibetensis]UOG75305.1 PA14 domain-containing protein [Hymenobacter tibetensis]
MQTSITTFFKRAKKLGALIGFLGLCSGADVAAQTLACTGNDPDGNPAGAGLYGQYYSGYFDDDQSFFSTRTPGLSRVDFGIYFPGPVDFGVLQPTAGGTATNPDNFSVRQQGSLRITTPGTYTFYLIADEAAYLWLDNAALSPNPTTTSATINNGGRHVIRTISASVYLTAGFHNILIHYGDVDDSNILVLDYENLAAGITRQAVPNSELCTSRQPARNLPTALSYSPSVQTVTAGSAATSAVPTLTSATTPQYVLANANNLPSGITINPTTGQLSLSAAVPVGRYSADISVINAEGATTFSQVYTFAVATAAPAACVGMRPDGGPATGGLYGEYYAGYFNDDPAFFTTTTPGIQRVDAQLNFTTSGSWGNLLPTATGTIVDPNLYSARYRGRIQIATAGTYTFYLTSDDASRMWIDDAALQATPTNSTALINNGGPHDVKTETATVTLTAGYHDVLLHYGDAGSGNVLILEYSNAAASIARQAIPTSALCSAASTMPQSVASAKTNKHSLSATPNPSAGSFTARVAQLQPKPGQLQVVDIHGRVCYEKALPSAAQQDVNVSVPNLAAGLYLLRLTTADGTSTQKIVIE